MSATDPGRLFADAVITLTVAPVDDSPAGFLELLGLDEDAAAVDFNRLDFFTDIETADRGLVFQATSTKPAAANAVVSAHFLRITPQPNANGGWMDSLVRIRAVGNQVQLVDRGAPRTSSPPQAGKSRFYQVKHLPIL